MQASPRCSNASAPSRHSAEAAACRLGWRPSRLQAAVLVVLGLLAVPSVLASGLPAPAGWILAAAAPGYALWRARRYLAQPAVEVVWNASKGTATVGGAAVGPAALAWRGSLALLRWRDRGGRRRCLAFWPDVLAPRSRRELRLAGAGVAASPRRASVAP